MTVEVLPPFASDFGDLSKSFGLLDNIEPFSFDEMAMLESASFDFPALAAAGSSAAAVVPDVVNYWPETDEMQQQAGQAGVAAPAAADTPGFVKLEDLNAAQLPGASRASPASSGSQTSCYAPSCDGASSDFTGSRSPTSAKKDPRIGKRKPDVDLATISDPAERRKQRRLAKNRATAATSRERKRKQMSELQHRVNQLEATNASLNKLLAQRDQELATLRNGAHNRAPH
jgi:cyclic AMP-dependent transcription factor ATF-2